MKKIKKYIHLVNGIVEDPDGDLVKLSEIEDEVHQFVRFCFLADQENVPLIKFTDFLQLRSENKIADLF